MPGQEHQFAERMSVDNQTSQEQEQEQEKGQGSSGGGQQQSEALRKKSPESMGLSGQAGGTTAVTAFRGVDSQNG